MAMQTPLEHESGVFAWYHRVLEVRFDFHNKLIEFDVQNFVNAGAAENGKRSLSTEVVRLKLDALAEDPRKWIYKILTTLPSSPFVGASSDEAASPAAKEPPTLTEAAKVPPALPDMPQAPKPRVSGVAP
jgi:hypothetical protein